MGVGLGLGIGIAYPGNLTDVLAHGISETIWQPSPVVLLAYILTQTGQLTNVLTDSNLPTNGLVQGYWRTASP